MNTRGNITIALLFFLLTSMLGLALLTHTLTHCKISVARSKKILGTNEISQALFLYLHHFKEIVLSADAAAFESPIDYFTQDRFPAEYAKNSLVQPTFTYLESQKPDYRETRIIATLDASSRKNPYRLKAEADIDILAGRLPLTTFPVLVDRVIDQPADAFLAEKGIVNRSDKKAVVADIQPVFDSGRFLFDSLKVSGSTLTWAALRERFGLEPVDEPIPEGIYLPCEDGVIGAVFVQGPVEKIILSAGKGRQRIGIVKGGNRYNLSYLTGGQDFQCWDPGIANGTVFSQKLIINGNVASIEQEGTSSFLPGCCLTMLVSGQAVITSNLETGSLDVNPLALGKLVLISSGGFLPGSASPDTGIIIDAGENAHIEASLITSAKIENRQAKLSLSGSLAAADLDNQGIIEVTYRAPGTDTGAYFQTGDYTYINQFLISYIEEVYNENE